MIGFKNIYGLLKVGKQVTIIYILIAVILSSTQKFIVNSIEYSNFIIFIISGILDALIILIYTKTREEKIDSCKNSADHFGKTILLCSILLFAVQMLLIYAAAFRTGWDAGTIFLSATQYADGVDMSENSWYFSRYPNNYGLLILEGSILKILKFFKLTAQQYQYNALEVVGCISVNISLLLMAFIIRKWSKSNKISFLGWGVGAILIGISPWQLVPYSDSYGMLFTMAILFLYVCSNNALKWPLLIIIVFIGSKIKPTVVIAFIAIVSVEIICILSKLLFTRETIACFLFKKKVVGTIAIVLIAMVGIDALENGFINSLSMTLDTNESFGIAHYMMMGANLQSMGSFCESDVEYSASFDSTQERTQNNLAVWRERLQQMGVPSLFKLFKNKTLLNYSDGTFTWGQEGNFFVEIYGKIPEVQTFYGIDQKNKDGYRLLAQIVWSMVLLLVMTGVSKTPIYRQEYVVYIAVLGISAFLTIFECRGRYLFLYAPYYVILAMMGVQNIMEKYARKKSLPE